MKTPSLLDAHQRVAVFSTEGPICIIAGPGSGKTRVIVERIVYLLKEKHVAPEYIFAITFTNKAAREIRERVIARLEEYMDIACPYIGTFHSFAFDTLTSHAERAGIALPLSLVAESQRRALLHKVLKEYPAMRMRDALSHISIYKSRCAPQDVGAEIKNVVEAYQHTLREKNLVDFDDLLLRLYELLKTHPDILKKYQHQFEYIMVDEYQDTNPIQADILSLLAPPQNNICVIGDSHQAIYGFRGATAKNFSAFQLQHTEASVITLLHNYRSTPVIVRASNALTADQNRKAARDSGDAHPIYIVNVSSSIEEARYIVKTIQKLIGGVDLNNIHSEKGYHLGDVGVLYRVNEIGRELEKYFEHAGIPYQRVGGTNFFDYPEIKFVIDALQSYERSPLMLSDQIREVIETHRLEKQYDEKKYNRILQLLSIAAAYDGHDPLAARKLFLKDVLLSREEEAYLSKDAVSLISAHTAKGLEFPVVFITGAEEGLFPISRNIGDGEQNNTKENDEEKRLFYVAMTRAKEQLYITHCEKRTLFGKTYHPQPSRFLKSIPEDLVERIIIPKKKKSSQGRLF